MRDEKGKEQIVWLFAAAGRIGSLGRWKDSAVLIMFLSELNS